MYSEWKRADIRKKYEIRVEKIYQTTLHPPLPMFSYDDVSCKKLQ